MIDSLVYAHLAHQKMLFCSMSSVCYVPKRHIFGMNYDALSRSLVVCVTGACLLRLDEKKNRSRVQKKRF